MKSDKYIINSQDSEYDVRSCLKCKDMQLFQFIDNKWVCLNCLKRKLNKKRRKGEEQNMVSKLWETHPEEQ